jgi:hypothetical protein
MTTTEAPTTDQLHAQLAAAQEQREAAEQNLGAATLDRKGETAATKELERATAEVRRLEAAITVSDSRAAEADHVAQIAAEGQRRIDTYRWVVEYMPYVKAVVAAREALDIVEAEATAAARSCPRRAILSGGTERVTKDGITRRLFLAETDLDLPATEGIPFGPDGHLNLLPGHTCDRCDEIAARAQAMIEAEENGKAADLAVTGAQRAAERQAERRVRADQRKAEMANAEAQAKAKRERRMSAPAPEPEPETDTERSEREAAEFRSSALERETAGAAR